MNTKQLLLTVLLAITSYVVHKQLKNAYYMHCSSDILRVLLFGQSDFCLFMKRIVDAIEGNYVSIVRQLYEVAF